MDQLLRQQLVDRFVTAILQLPGQTKENIPSITQKAEAALDLAGEEALLPISRTNVISFVKKLLSDVPMKANDLNSITEEVVRRTSWGMSAPDLSEGIAAYKEYIVIIFQSEPAGELIMRKAFTANPRPSICWDLFSIIPLA